MGLMQANEISVDRHHEVGGRFNVVLHGSMIGTYKPVVQYSHSC